ncbi:MAG: PAS domain S-box protein, partial [Pseudomonadota bacterium]
MNKSAEMSMLEALLASAVDGIITIRADGTIVSANPAAGALFKYGQEEFTGRNVKFLMPEPYQGEHDGYLASYLRSGDKKIIGIGREVQGLRSDGTVFPMHLSVSEYIVDGARFFTGIIHDLSERNQTERALQHALKMDAIGQLTGGIAHDFNNLLTVIIGNLELLEMRIESSAERDLISEAQEAAELGARLTSRLLAFARRSPLEPAAIELNDLTLGLTEILHRTLGET